jgi:DNA-directed RNA polymerase specialized sigma24 family protein
VPVKITPRVLHAIDDLTNEIFLRLRQELGEQAVEDPQGSLCATLLEIEQDCAEINANEAADALASCLTKSDEVIKRALQALTPDQRDALYLHLGKGMTCLEIAQQTGVAREEVLNDLVRAYARIRLLLSGERARKRHK